MEKKVILKADKTWKYDESKTESKNTCVIELISISLHYQIITNN